MFLHNRLYISFISKKKKIEINADFLINQLQKYKDIQVLCSRNEVASYFSNRTLEYLRPNFPWDRLILR